MKKFIVAFVFFAMMAAYDAFAAEPSIVEITDEEVVVKYTDRVFRPVRRPIQVPDNLDGQYVVAVAVVVDAPLDDTQETALENAIEAIVTGPNPAITLAKVLVGTSPLSLSRMPADVPDPDGAGPLSGTDYQFWIELELGYDVKKVSVNQ